MKKVTIADVAKEANVSISTVSQFMNKRYEYMGVETRSKIEEAVAKLNYRPNILARSLKNKGTQTIGIIVANIMHSFTTQIIYHLERNFQKHGFHVTVCNANDDPATEREHIEMLLAKQVDGFMIFPTGDNLALYESLYNQGIPVVFIDRLLEECKIPSVLLNNELASLYAVEALVAKGYKQLAMVTSSIERKITPRIERLQGFEKAMNKQNLPYSDAQVIAASLEEIPNQLKGLFEQADVDAIIAGNDRVLLVILQYLKTHQSHKFKDMGVAVIDDIAMAKFIEPAIITIEQPTDLMAEKAVDLFLQIKKKGYTVESNSVYRFDPTI